MSALAPLSISVSGHRDLIEADLESVRGRVRNWFGDISRLYTNTPLRFISGLAEGADRLAAECFLEVRDELRRSGCGRVESWEFVVALPMPQSIYEDDFPDTIAEFRYLISRADTLVVLTDELSQLNDGSDSEFRLRGYESLAEYILRYSNIILALWDGKIIDKRAGTSHVVQARLGAMSSPAIAPLHVGCGAVYHIHVRRKSDPAQILTVDKWLWPDLADLHEADIRDSFRKLDSFNRLSAALPSEDASTAALSMIGNSPELLKEDCGLDLHRIMAVQRAADRLAVSCEQKRRKLITFIHLLAAALAAVLWTGLDGVIQPAMAFLYAIMLLTIYVMYRIWRRPEVSDAPIYYRFLAEALRISVYWRVGTQSSATSSACFQKNVVGTLMQQQWHEIGWAKEFLRFDTGTPPPQCPKRLQVEIVTFWINDQKNYFRHSENRSKELGRLLGTASWTLAFAGILAAAIVFYHDQAGLDHRTFRHVASISAAVFPAIGLLIQSYLESLGYTQREKTALRMQWIFDRADTRLRLALTEADRMTAVRDLCGEALLEAVNWLIFRKAKPPSMPT